MERTILFSLRQESRLKEWNKMKYIKKSNPPIELITYRKTPGATYQDLYDNHKDIWELTRLSLAEEQGYICCYCGQRISGFQGTQIEHVFAKGTAAYEKMQLDYESNLLACCDGGKYARRLDPTIPYADLYCDTPKESTPIPVTPLNPLCEEKFLYGSDGDIVGVGADAEATIDILNLRSPILKNKRKSAIDAYSMFATIDWQREYERLNNKNSNGEYTEFCFVLRSYIECFHAESLHS